MKPSTLQEELQCQHRPRRGPLSFRREEPVIDAALLLEPFRPSQIRTGSLDNEVTASRRPRDRKQRQGLVNVYWSMTRFKAVDGEQGRQTFDHPAPHTDISFGVDEIEAFATAGFTSCSPSCQTARRAFRPNRVLGKLNKRAVDATKPSTADVFVWEEGFGLKVTPRGGKYFSINTGPPSSAASAGASRSAHTDG